jgi:hypothetical protein
MTDFDVAATIAEFLADESRSMLELPHMTTGQRKKTKTLVDKYPELRCASFGFGAERQLHLFKGQADCAAQQSPLKTSLDCKGAGEVCDSPDRSTTCSSNTSPRSINHDKDIESAKHLSFANVRNTFIHFDDRPVDERTVQSMPHGMFGKCMLAEASQKRDEDNDRRVEDTTPSKVALGDTRVAFSVGALVMVDGLVKTPMFNGLAAVVQGWDEASGRYRIVFGQVGGNGAAQKAMVKEENLKLISPCP